MDKSVIDPLVGKNLTLIIEVRTKIMELIKKKQAGEITQEEFDVYRKPLEVNRMWLAYKEYKEAKSTFEEIQYGMFEYGKI